jgi:DNA helicase-2/ATP-dependent DNA helicase PcrA
MSGGAARIEQLSALREQIFYFCLWLAQSYSRRMTREYELQPYRIEVHFKIDYASELNAQQFAAVTASPGPALVIAGAGSGKTRTLTYRVAVLIESGVAADRILLLTFTNKAAREMMRRVYDILQSDVSGLWGGTFHSIGNRVLRKHAAQLGYKPDFTILDRDDSKDLLQTCIDEAKIETTEVRLPKAEMMVDIFSMALNTQQELPALLARRYKPFAQFAEVLTMLERKFQSRKRANNVMDFDDLLALWLKLLQEHEDVRELYQNRFQYVLVDEYQDTNKLQSDIIDILAKKHRNVMAVGDDSQSIYSWRGANFKNIIHFPKRYPEAKVYKIETNYRSTPEILNLANAAIAHNVDQYEKTLLSHREEGPKPALVICEEAREQAAFVAQRALELRDEGIELAEIAVLYRSHFHALELQLELTRRNIPFTITSGMRFFEQAHIKDVTAYLRFLVNPLDEISFKRIIKMLPGVGNKGAEKIWLAFLDALQAGAEQSPDPASPQARNPLACALQACAKQVSKKSAKAWAQLTATISQMEAPDKRNNPAELIQLIREAVYEDYARENFANYGERLEDLSQWISFAADFNDTQEFLSQLALLSNIDSETEKVKTNKQDEENLRLTTIHQAKGLEFKVVFMIMLCDGLFPSARSIEDEDAIEEERRLFYVAITRAKDELYLSYPRMRFTQGYSMDPFQRPSRFLEELPKNLMEEWNLRSPGMPGESGDGDDDPF